MGISSKETKGKKYEMTIHVSGERDKDPLTSFSEDTVTPSFPQVINSVKQ
jgi:hypothetical protein